MQLSLSPPDGLRADRPHRWATLALFASWLALVAWFCSAHVFWRDEVRAFSLALSGSSYAEMLRDVHGEGHPALWYLILRSTHDLLPYREVLPVAGAIIGIAAMTLIVFYSPFRIMIKAAIIFSAYGAFEFVAMARNYGISALVMFALAGLYGRVRRSFWFGVLLAVLCNTNVPSCLAAAAFLLFRFVELLTEPDREQRDWIIFAGNVLLASLGAYLCFITVYPTFNDEAVSRNLGHLGFGTIISALADSEWGFAHLAFDFLPAPFNAIPFNAILLTLSCLGLVRRPAALAASLAALIAFKLFFYFVYFSSYRHEILYVIFLLALYWMVEDGAGGTWQHRPWHDRVQLVGTAVFLALLAVQSGRLLNAVHMQIDGIPDSSAAKVAKLLQRPELSRAIVMGDPDTMLEPLPYYVDNPIWLLRQQRFGHVVPLATKGRHELGMEDVLSDAMRLHRQTGRPVVFLSHLNLQDQREEHFPHMIFRDATTLRPREVRHFLESTTLIAKLWGAGSDEEYDVYVYPVSATRRDRLAIAGVNHNNQAS